MHLCIQTQYYLPEIGAPQARLSELAQHFIANGHSVTVLTAMPNYPTGKIFRGYGGLYRSEVIDGVKVIRTYVFPSKSVRKIPRLWNYFSFVLSSFFIGAIALPRCDVMITESPPLFLGLSGFILSKVKRAKWIFNVSDLWPESAVNLGIIGDGLALDVSKWLEASFYGQASLVTGQSHEIVNNIEQRFPEIETYRLSNGVDVIKFNPNKKSDILSQWSKGKKLTAVYAGLHGIAQGLDQILKAAITLEKSTPDLQIILIGDGAEKGALMAMAEELKLSNISFVDPQQRELIPEILASANIALIPLKQYIPGAVPSKLYEAMASGLPVVLIAEGEPADIVKMAKCGYVVRPDHIEGIAKAVESLAMNKELGKIMAETGRNSVIKSYDRNNILNDFRTFIEMNQKDL